MPTFANGAMAVHKQAGGRLRGVAASGLGLLLAGATLVGTTGSGVTATAGAAVRPLAQRQVSDRSGGVQSSPLVRITYSLVRDSGGEGPQKGAEIILLFSANGEAYLYLADPTEALGELGTYSYQAGKLKLRIVTSDININATFALSLTETEVKMPFQIFSAKPGSSLWLQQPLAIDQGIYGVFDAAMNATGLNLTTEGAAAQAYAYAQAWVGAGSSAHSQQVLSTSSMSQAHGTLAGARAPLVHLSGRHLRAPASPPSLGITGVVSLGDDIEILYKDGPPLLVELCAWPNSGAGNAPLVDSPLASDPRVHLDPTVHPDGRFDPPHKTAVIFDPFTKMPWEPFTHTALTEIAAIYQVEATLTEKGYTISELLNQNATIEGIADALGKGSGVGRPRTNGAGILAMSTHGNEAGDLETADTVKVFDPDQGAVDAAYLKEKAVLAKEGLRSLALYDNNHGFPTTFVLMDKQCSLLLLPESGGFATLHDNCSFHLGLTPTFWKWLRNAEKVSFSDSLVYISACQTDHSNLLRDAIDAKAYFAYSLSVTANLATAVMEYLIDDLARPTHSPEEAFYNMIRVDNTSQMIYKEDHLLDGVLGKHGTDEAIVGNLDGWGWNGSALVPYDGSGWDGEKAYGIDPGQIWWMLFAARWDKDAIEGAAELTNCLDEYWVNGEPGGLANEFCNSANAGLLSNKERVKADVAYAVYLLTGEPPAGFPQNDIVPRWTMDDSG
ncbi:MAG: hypothetical protein ACLP1E_03875 [Acidimicrobiales bacterium]